MGIRSLVFLALIVVAISAEETKKTVTKAKSAGTTTKAPEAPRKPAVAEEDYYSAPEKDVKEEQPKHTEHKAPEKQQSEDEVEHHHSGKEETAKVKTVAETKETTTEMKPTVAETTTTAKPNATTTRPSDKAKKNKTKDKDSASGIAALSLVTVSLCLAAYTIF